MSKKIEHDILPFMYVTLFENIVLYKKYTIHAIIFNHIICMCVIHDIIVS